MRIQDQTWNDIDIVEIYQTDGEESILFIKCASQEDAAKITAHAVNLPASSDQSAPRLGMHIDQRARLRHRAIQRVAKSIRDELQNTVQTSIRNGKFDFLLRVRDKKDQSKWSQIAPVVIRTPLPPFEIGNFKSDYLDHSVLQEESDREEDENREMEMIQREIQSQVQEEEARSIPVVQADTQSNPAEQMAPKSQAFKHQLSPSQSQTQNKNKHLRQNDSQSPIIQEEIWMKPR